MKSPSVAKLPWLTWTNRNGIHTPATRHCLTPVELDLLYELTRQARNSLPDPYDTPEPGSWAAAIIALDDKLTTLFHKRRR
jgi:hypothetical protein